GDPGAVLPGARLPGACSDHAGKGLIIGDLKPSGTDYLPHAFADFQFVGEQHKPFVWRIPQNGYIVAIPGKNAVLVSRQEPLWPEVAANGQQTIRLGQCRIWKSNVFRTEL